MFNAEMTTQVVFSEVSKSTSAECRYKPTVVILVCLPGVNRAQVWVLSHSSLKPN